MTNKGNHYFADDGKMLVRTSDGRVMGDGLQLGVGDSIDNYEEREFTEDERAAFWKSIGMRDPKKEAEGTATVRSVTQGGRI